MPTAIGILSAVNVLRTREGRPPLTASGTLMVLAFARARGMSEGKYLGHEDPNGRSPTARRLLEEAGFQGPVGELVYGSRGSLDTLPADAGRAWQAGQANLEALMSADYHFAGVGVMGDGTWWKVSLLLAQAEP